MKNVIAVLMLVLLSTVTIQAQRILVLPFEFSFRDASESKASLGEKMLGIQTFGGAKYDSLISVEYTDILKDIIKQTLDDGGREFVMIEEDDLSDKLREELSTAGMRIRYASKSSSMLLGRKSYENAMGVEVAPLFNKLADKYDVEQILYLSASASNERKKFKEKNKTPSGKAFATANLFDADDALIIKKKIVGKGDGDNRIAKFTITHESVAEILSAAINKVIK